MGLYNNLVDKFWKMIEEKSRRKQEKRLGRKLSDEEFEAIMNEKAEKAFRFAYELYTEEPLTDEDFKRILQAEEKSENSNTKSSEF